MIQSILLLVVLFNASLFGEGFSSNTLVATCQGGLQTMDLVCQGFDVYALDIEGKLVKGRIIKKETSKQYIYFELTVDDKKVYADAEQHFYCPNRDAWVKLAKIDPRRDSVLSLIKGVLPVQNVKKVNIASSGLMASMHRLSVETYATFFVSEDLILTHNYTPVIIPLAYLLMKNMIEIGATVLVTMVKAYLTEKMAVLAEKVTSFMQAAMQSSSNNAGVSPTTPNVDALAPAAVRSFWPEIKDIDEDTLAVMRLMRDCY